MDGTTWTTDKDGIVLGLLAAEITARLGVDPGAPLRRAHPRVRRAGLRADRRARRRMSRSGCSPSSPRAGRRARTGGRPDPRDPDHRSRQRGSDRRTESDHRQRMVCRPPVRHGGGLQAVRGEFPRPPASRTDPGGGAGARHQTLRAGGGRRRRSGRGVMSREVAPPEAGQTMLPPAR